MVGRTGQPLRHAEPLTTAASPLVRLRRQWAILAEPTPDVASWPYVQLRSGRTILHHPDTRITKVDGEDSSVVVLGPVVSTDAEVPLIEQLRHLVSGDEHEAVETIRRFAGTYVIIHHEASRVRIYTDPAGMMQVFYRGGDVSSTPALLAPLERDTTLDQQFPFGTDNDWFPGTLTPFRDVHALPANHVLTIPDGTIVRFWPTQQPRSLATDEGVRRLAELLQRIVAATIENGPVLCSLTGGRDSRVNLAALGEQARSVEFFTIRGAGVQPCDTRIPREIAARWNLDHRFVDNVTATPWLMELYDEMTCGLSIGGRRAVVGAAASLAGPEYIHLNGNLGALAKSFFWHSRNPRSVRVRALGKELTHRPLPITAAIEGWLASVPELDPPTIYNLMYLEQRGGRWMGIGETASALFYDSLSPFCSREVFETICGLPTATQFGGELLVELVRKLQPELLDVEYCRARRNWSGHVPRLVKNRVKRLIGPRYRG